MFEALGLLLIYWAITALAGGFIIACFLKGAKANPHDTLSGPTI
jgi:hypothetical protein